MNNEQLLLKDIDTIISDINEGLANTLIEDGKVAAEYKEILKTNLILNVGNNKEEVKSYRDIIDFHLSMSDGLVISTIEEKDKEFKNFLERYAIELAKGLLGGLGIKYNNDDILSATDFIWDWEPLMA